MPKFFIFLEFKFSICLENKVEKGLIAPFYALYLLQLALTFDICCWSHAVTSGLSSKINCHLVDLSLNVGWHVLILLYVKLHVTSNISKCPFFRFFFVDIFEMLINPWHPKLNPFKSIHKRNHFFVLHLSNVKIYINPTHIFF